MSDQERQELIVSTLWFVDRSRIVDGRGFCQRARALGYHLGQNGYGIAMKGTRLPLMTGIAGHDGLAPILQWCVENDDLIVQGLQMMHDKPPESEDGYLPVPTGVVRAGVQAAQAKYWKAVEARGFAYLEENAEVQAVTREQNYLIEGLIWAWCLDVLPEILLRCRIVEAEVDDSYVFDCTCGLGDGIGTQQDHTARACQGIALMCRPDFVGETRLTKELEYHEFKTTSMDSITFRDKWEVMMQMFSATLDVERRLGKHVQSIYIHGLIKGKRGGEYNPATRKYDGGTWRQGSIFCYGYKKPANPPMEAEVWEASYEWQEDGQTRRLGKAYVKTGVWELPDDLIPEGMSKGEFWAKWIGPEVRKKNLMVLGPFSRQTQMVAHFIEEATGEERRWQEGLWLLYDLAQDLLKPYTLVNTETGEETCTADYWANVWADPRYQQLLDRLFPRSYECRRYGGRNRCQFETICFEREGWQDPIGSNLYIERRPHHKDELEQAQLRGLLLVEEGAAEDVEMELP